MVNVVRFATFSQIVICLLHVEKDMFPLNPFLGNEMITYAPRNDFRKRYNRYLKKPKIMRNDYARFG